MITAVLEARCGVTFAGSDVYLNVAGGLKISEPAADLAVAAALLSSLSGVPAPTECVIFGEVGLSAEVRAVSHTDGRLKEAAKLGFTRALIPSSGKSKTKARAETTMRLDEISTLQDLVTMFQDDSNVGRRVG
jgi:DNA repair protein RadA/Sms